MTVSIEQFVPRDLERIEEIERSSTRFLTPFSLLARYYTIPDEGIMVARVGDRIVGFVVANVEKGQEGHILSIAVDPGYMKQGVGGSLLEAIIGVLKQLGANRVRVELKTYNESARKFYLASGFKESGVIRGHYSMRGYSEDALVMIKEF